MDILLHDGDAQILLRASAAVVKLMQNKVLLLLALASSFPSPLVIVIVTIISTAAASFSLPLLSLLPFSLVSSFLQSLCGSIPALLTMQQILACKTQEDLLMVLKPKEGTLTLEKGSALCLLLLSCGSAGKAIEADQLIKVVFTALPPIPDLPQRRALLDQSFRDKLRFSPHMQLAPCPIAGI